MKKILVATLLSTFFAASPLLAMCPSCRPNVIYLPGPQAAAQPRRPIVEPAAAVQPVLAESAAAVKSVNSRIVTVNSEEHFKALTSSGNVLVKFGSTQCKPCGRLTIELEKVAEKYGQLKVVYVDTDAHQNLTFQNKISSLPTMQFYKNGAQVGQQVVGYKTEAEVKNMIQNNFGL